MNVITISGPAQGGKTTMGEELKRVFEKEGYAVKVTNYGDFLKMILETQYGWIRGDKSPAGRALLQKIGTDVLRKNNPDIFVDMMISFIRGLGDTVDILIIADARFKNEIIKLRESRYVDKVISVKVDRRNYDDRLTAAQKKHASEHGLDDFSFDIVVKNDADLAAYLKKAQELTHYYRMMNRTAPIEL